VNEEPSAPPSMPQRYARIATVLCLITVGIYVSPLWLNLHTWGGTFDWGYFFFLAEVDRATVVQYGQFPFWNPYYCGGAVHLANPQTYFLSPTFLFIWAFGTPLGIRLTLTTAILLAVDGMRRFLRALGVNPVPALVGGTGYAVSGALAQHLGGGHVGWVGFCVLPYVLHSFHRAFDGDGQKRHVLYGGLFLAWIFGHFGGYTYPYSGLTLGIWGMLWAVARRRPLRGVAVIAGISAFSVGLAAVRMLPILEFMRGHPRIRPDVDIVRPSEFWEIYAVHHTERGVPGHPYVWPEYGNFLGIAAVVLVAIGVWVVARHRKALRPLAYATVIFLVFQIGNVPGFPWWLLKHLPVLRFMRAPCRFTILAGMFACGLVAVAVDRLVSPLGFHGLGGRLMTRERRLLGLAGALLAIGFIADASAFNRGQWFQTLTTPPPAETPARSFEQVRGSRHRMYAYPRQNRGTLDCFEEAPLDISPRLRTGQPEEYPLEDSMGTVRRVSWSPNQIVVDTDFQRPGVVVVNQNFHKSWHAEGGGVFNEGGLLAARVAAGRHRVRFWFLPTSFLIGLAVTLSTFVCGAWLWWRWAPHRARAVLRKES
jgi:hypothetical protein